MVFKGRAGDALEGSPMNAQNKHAYCVEELWRSLVDETPRVVLFVALLSIAILHIVAIGMRPPEKHVGHG